MPRDFYNSKMYRERQCFLTKQNWLLGKFDGLKKCITEKCANLLCDKEFIKTPSDPKKFCSKSCAVAVNNKSRILSEGTKRKISVSLLGKMSPFKGIIKIPRLIFLCQNLKCGREIVFERWKTRKYCSNACAMSVIGGQPTSPRAARAKAGIRSDLGDIYFYSRWEANFARLLNSLSIQWNFQPRTFDLINQKYTPDFYLPNQDIYVEIKNFLSDFSYQRDKRFRELYPDINLYLLLKEDYLTLQEQFSDKIENWEYS